MGSSSHTRNSSGDHHSNAQNRTPRTPSPPSASTPIITSFSNNPHNTSSINSEPKPVPLPMGCCVHVRWTCDEILGGESCSPCCSVNSRFSSPFTSRSPSYFGTSFNIPESQPIPLLADLSANEYTTIRNAIRSTQCYLAIWNAGWAITMAAGLAVFAMVLESTKGGTCHSDEQKYLCFNFPFVVSLAAAHVAFVVFVFVTREVGVHSLVRKLNGMFESKALRFSWRQRYLRVSKGECVE